MEICNRCCMDSTAEEITFNVNGVCNFCFQATKALREIEIDKPNLSKIIEQIKKDGIGKDYDILIGLSGGIDSSTALINAVKLGLRPLCFSMDNGYNSPISDENVLRLVEALKVPFERRVIDLKKFRELQDAFIKAGVPNIEIPTDHIIMALSFQIASEYDIKWIISGGNVATESIMPPSWGYSARDLTHIKDIFKKMTGKRLKGLPTCGLIKWNWYRWIKKIKNVYLLDYLDYNRKESIELLQKEYGWQDYGDKHEENNFTKWFQNFYLYEKFGFDKRKAHYSSLINSGQMTRDEALSLLTTTPVYPELGIEKKVMKYPKTSHDKFKKDEKIWLFMATFIRLLKKLFQK